MMMIAVSIFWLSFYNLFKNSQPPGPSFHLPTTIMTKKLSILLILGLLPLCVWAQRITGTVSDSSGQPLPGASIILVQEVDSTIASFVLTNEAGEFRLPGLKPLPYSLKVSFLGYATVEKRVDLTRGQKEEDLGAIVLYPEDLVTDQVDIEAERSPIQLKGDTLSYNADVFDAQPGELVEDLLKKLPGVEVDESGNIKAQGRNVGKVRVDGEEFFGDDPKMATKNLPADAIKSVEVYDEKTDEEDISGTDDGEVNQTINLTLKEDKKRGYFGNVEGGYGSDDRYTLKGNVNRFAPKAQFSLIGLSNNINENGFSISEYIEFMGGIGSFMKDGVINIPVDENSGIPISALDRNGILTTQGGGINSSIELTPKLQFNANYMLSGLGTRREEDFTREQFLEEDFFTSENERMSRDQFYSHRLSTGLRFRGDSIARFRFNLNLGYRGGQNRDSSMTEVFGVEGNLENSSRRINQSEAQKIDGEASFSYLTRILKKGRTISFRGRIGGEMSNQTGLFEAANTLFLPRMTLTNDLSQDQSQEENKLTYGGRVQYTEPLGKVGNRLQFTYAIQNYRQNQDRDVFDLFPFRERNTLLSNSFRRDYMYQTVGSSFNLKGEKAGLQLGVDYQTSRLEGFLFTLSDSIDQQFQNFLPNLRFYYQWKDGLKAGLRYRTSFDEPSLTQLQPFIDNRDPFNLYQGNPGLRPSYTHNLAGDIYWYDPFSFTSLFTYIWVNYTQNSIVEVREVDSLFRQIRRPLNVDNSLRVGANINLSTPIRPLGIKISLSNRLSYNNGITFVNGQENVVNRISNTAGLSLENRKKEVFDLAVGGDWGFNQATYSDASQFDRNFLNQNYFVRFRLNFLKNWVFRSEFSWAIYAGGNFAEDVQVPLLEASLTRQFFDKKLRVELLAFDILNQNLGVSRRAELNFVEDGNSLTLRRYVMVKVSYSLGSKN